MLHNWNFFYSTFVLVLILGILAGIFSNPINKIMKSLESKASGRNAQA